MSDFLACCILPPPCLPLPPGIGPVAWKPQSWVVQNLETTGTSHETYLFIDLLVCNLRQIVDAVHVYMIGQPLEICRVRLVGLNSRRAAEPALHLGKFTIWAAAHYFSLPPPPPLPGFRGAKHVSRICTQLSRPSKIVEMYRTKHGKRKVRLSQNDPKLSDVSDCCWVVSVRLTRLCFLRISLTWFREAGSLRAYLFIQSTT